VTAATPLVTPTKVYLTIPVPQRLRWPLLHAERPRDGRQHQRRIGERGEVHEARAAGEGALEGGGHLDGQPGLADARRPGQGQQAHVRAVQLGAHEGHVPLAPDQWSRRQGQIFNRRCACHHP
jgi:hypothetical protein